MFEEKTFRGFILPGQTTPVSQVLKSILPPSQLKGNMYSVISWEVGFKVAHNLPWNFGAGLSQVLLFFWFPVLQVTSQGAQWSHSVQCPSTKTGSVHNCAMLSCTLRFTRACKDIALSGPRVVAPAEGSVPPRHGVVTGPCFGVHTPSAGNGAGAPIRPSAPASVDFENASHFKAVHCQTSTLCLLLGQSSSP